MQKERFYKVKYGYGAADQASIPESRLEKAIYAQAAQLPIQLNNSFVNGKHIISITPHYHKHTGWNEWYEPKDGDDWAQIQRDCPKYDGVMEYHADRVSFLMSHNRTKEIGTGVHIEGIEPPTHALKLLN